MVKTILKGPYIGKVRKIEMFGSKSGGSHDLLHQRGSMFIHLCGFRFPTRFDLRKVQPSMINLATFAQMSGRSLSVTVCGSYPHANYENSIVHMAVGSFADELKTDDVDALVDPEYDNTVWLNSALVEGIKLTGQTPTVDIGADDYGRVDVSAGGKRLYLLPGKFPPADGEDDKVKDEPAIQNIVSVLCMAMLNRTRINIQVDTWVADSNTGHIAKLECPAA
jgi:hypothetical protein